MALGTEDALELAEPAWLIDVLDTAGDVGIPASLGKEEEIEEAIVACVLEMLLPLT